MHMNVTGPKQWWSIIMGVVSKIWGQWLAKKMWAQASMHEHKTACKGIIMVNTAFPKGGVHGKYYLS